MYMLHSHCTHANANLSLFQRTNVSGVAGKNAIQWFMLSAGEMQICAMKCAVFSVFRILFCVPKRNYDHYITHISLANPICLCRSLLFPAASFLPFDSLPACGYLCTLVKTLFYYTALYSLESHTMKLLMKTGQNPIEKSTAKSSSECDKDAARSDRKIIPPFYVRPFSLDQEVALFLAPRAKYIFMRNVPNCSSNVEILSEHKLEEKLK